jgi:ATP-dependent exoDNAse (exonuclease V) beta subunit
MTDNQINAVPFAHESMDTWRHTLPVLWPYTKNQLTFFGAVDDIWVNENGELLVVDYKATSKDKEVSLDSDWQITYKRQMEVYQWLLRQNGFTVNDLVTLCIQMHEWM